MYVIYTVDPPLRSVFPLVFLSMFRLESSYNCNKDFLEIREGNSTGPLVSRLCGIRLPSNYTSVTGHILWLRFRSDASVSGVGFQANFVHCECFEWQT